MIELVGKGVKSCKSLWIDSKVRWLWKKAPDESIGQLLVTIGPSRKETTDWIGEANIAWQH
jgi:hypothetical protein